MASNKRIVESVPERMHGTPVFHKTRVPIRALTDWLAGGHTLERFLENFPTVSRAQALAALEFARKALEASAHPPRRVRSRRTRARTART